MSAGGGPGAAPGISSHIGWIDFPCLEKLMQQVAAQRPPSSCFICPVAVSFPRLYWLHPRCLASIRTLNGPLWARCTLGSDLKARSITVVMDLGMLGAAICRAISKGPAGFSQSPEQGGGCHFQSNLLETALIRADQQQVAFLGHHSNALRIEYLSCSCWGHPRG